MSCEKRERILVIKFGALGDFVQALGPFHAIRHHHQSAHITLLTTARFLDLGNRSSFFDEIWTFVRPSWWHFRAKSKFKATLNGISFSRVYDLQTSKRSSSYFNLFEEPRPEWSGIAEGCSHPHNNPKRNFMHTIERQKEQLSVAGISVTPTPSFDWLDSNIDHFSLSDNFVLILPGGSARRAKKRWPVCKYIELANDLVLRGQTPVLLGGEDEKDVMAIIQRGCSHARNLCSKTNVFEIAGLARRAAGAVGNDTGPMHIAAEVGCPSVILFSAFSDPSLCGQRGKSVKIIRRKILGELGSSEVLCALLELEGR